MKSIQPPSTTVVAAGRVCPRCGVPLGGYGPEGLCGACLLGDGVADEELEPALATPTAPARRVGDYELLEEIARGGMGVVYKARQTSLNRVVAVKMILRGEFASPADLARFRQEAEAAAHLKHPNIVAIHEVGEHEGQQFFSMDYIEGRSLSAVVREGPLPAPQAARYVEKIARPVHYAHEQGVLHRDLKPSNVLLDTQDEPHVTDFGLAKRLSEPGARKSEVELTLSGQVMGTPSFMPPEQAAGQRGQMGPHSDVYSLGAILYHLLTGRPPFVGSDAHAILGQVLTHDAVAPRLLNPAVPRDLETLCLKCLEKEPSRRYSSAKELAEDLTRQMRHEPILAVPPSAAYRAQKFVRRHWVGVSVAAGFVVMMAVATAVSTVFGFRANRERAAALKAREEATARAAEARDVLGFFEDRVLAAARPEDEDGGLGRLATIRAALDAAEPTIEKTFGHRPMVEASIRHTLARTYYDLGEYPTAIRQYERAAHLWEATVGSNHTNFRRARNALALACTQAGRISEAISMLEPLLGAITNAPGFDPGEASGVMSSLALAYRKAGRYAEALPLHEQALRLTKAARGPEHPDTLIEMGNLAEAYRAAGRRAEAVALMEETLKLRQATLGDTASSTLTSMHNLAAAYASATQFTNAFPLQQEAIRISRDKLGPDHPTTLKMLNGLANTYLEAARPNEAIPLLEEVVKLQQAKLGAGHPDTLTFTKNLATAYQKAGRLRDALPLHEATLRLLRTNLGPEHPSTLGALNDLAATYHQAGRFADAAPLLEESLKGQKALLGPEHPKTLNLMNNLAVAYQSLDRIPEAVALYEEALRGRKTALGAEHPDTLSTMGNLSTAYGIVGRSAEALALAEETLRLSKARFGPEHRDTLWAMNNLASCQMDAGRLAEAILLFEEALRLSKSLLGADHRNTLTATYNLATAYHAAGRPAEALPLLEQTLESRTATLGPNHPETLGAMKSLAIAYSSTNRFAEAERLLRQVLDIQLETRGNRSRTVADARVSLGQHLYRQKQYSEAETLAREALAVLEQAPGEAPALKARNLLGASLLGQGRYADAEPLLLQVHEAFQSRAAANPSRDNAKDLKDTTRRLIQLYEGWGKPDQAARWRDESK